MDFVLRRGEDLLGIEVKAAAMRQPRLSRAARSFIDAYRPARFLLVNLALEATERIDASGTEVRWITPEMLPELL